MYTDLSRFKDLPPVELYWQALNISRQQGPSYGYTKLYNSKFYLLFKALFGAWLYQLYTKFCEKCTDCTQILVKLSIVQCLMWKFVVKSMEVDLPLLCQPYLSAVYKIKYTLSSVSMPPILSLNNLIFS